jgi:hypothetical protein
MNTSELRLLAKPACERLALITLSFRRVFQVEIVVTGRS